MKYFILMKLFQSRCVFAILAIMFALAYIGASYNAAAQGTTSTKNIFKINNIKVKKESDDITAAKNEAFIEAKKQAFQNLVTRFLSYGYLKSAPTVSIEEIDDCIDNISVIEEFMTNNSYDVRLNFDFNPEKTSKLLKVEIISESPTKEKYLLVPVLIDNGKIMPWNNNWLAVWQQKQSKNITVPLGDLEDIRSLTAEDLARLDYNGLDTLARRYRLPIVLLAEAEYDVPKNKLMVSIKRFEDIPKLVAEHEYPGRFGIGSNELFVDAANDLAAKINNEGVPKTGEDLENPLADQDIYVEYERDYDGDKRQSAGFLKVSVATRSLADWSTIRRKLINSKLVTKLSVISFSPTQTEIKLYHVGDLSDLQRSLSTNGLTITEDQGKYMIDRIKTE